MRSRVRMSARKRAASCRTIKSMLDSSRCLNPARRPCAGKEPARRRVQANCEALRDWLGLIGITANIFPDSNAQCSIRQSIEDNPCHPTAVAPAQAGVQRLCVIAHFPIAVFPRPDESFESGVPTRGGSQSRNTRSLPAQGRRALVGQTPIFPSFRRIKTPPRRHVREHEMDRQQQQDPGEIGLREI